MLPEKNKRELVEKRLCQIEEDVSKYTHNTTGFTFGSHQKRVSSPINEIRCSLSSHLFQ